MNPNDLRTSPSAPLVAKKDPTEELNKTVAELRQSLQEESERGKRYLQDRIRAESLNNAYLAIITALAGVNK
ncbi:MAG: hypothetical protein ABFD82_18425 [Syntrophaceae bacterium]